MALVVEDGSGLLTADALISVDEYDSYHEDRNEDATTFEFHEKEAGIRRATQWMTYNLNWKGRPLLGRSQGTAFPRIEMYDQYDDLVPSDSVPREVKWLCAELARQELIEPGFLAPVHNQSQMVSRVKAGPVETTFVTARTGYDMIENRIPAMMSMVSGLLDLGGSQSPLSGRISRV